MEQGDINSEQFDNAIMISRCIKCMVSRNLLSDFEKDIIDAIASGYNYSEISRLFDVDRQRVSTTFRDVTDRIAFILGGEFTDAAFLERIKNKESLLEQDSRISLRKGVQKLNESAALCHLWRAS